MAQVIFNVEGRTSPSKLQFPVPACSSLVVGVHTLSSMPKDANFRTQVGWTGLGSATLILRPFDSPQNFENEVVMPPIAVFR